MIVALALTLSEPHLQQYTYKLNSIPNTIIIMYCIKLKISNFNSIRFGLQVQLLLSELSPSVSVSLYDYHYEF